MIGDRDTVAQIHIAVAILALGVALGFLVLASRAAAEAREAAKRDRGRLGVELDEATAALADAEREVKRLEAVLAANPGP